jgi:uncharacterized protein (TIGR01777 family)
MRALVTGATGFIGQALMARLESPRVLSRKPSWARVILGTAAEPFPWEPEAGPPPAEAFEGVDAVFHLAGDSVGEGRWTAAKKARIRDSRVRGTRNLVQALAALPVKPRVLVSASAVGWYGDRGDEVLEESAPAAIDFLGAVCAAWEAEARRAEAAGIRVVLLRTGVVLGPGGGALTRMLLPFRMGLGSPLGNGRQWMPWIHRDDLVGIALHAAATDSMAGPVNGVSPNPATNREFTKALGRALHRPTFFPPVPGFVLRAVLGEFSSVLLASTRAVPRAAERAGYVFRHPDLAEALGDCLGK